MFRIPNKRLVTGTFALLFFFLFASVTSCYFSPLNIYKDTSHCTISKKSDIPSKGSDTQLLYEEKEGEDRKDESHDHYFLIGLIGHQAQFHIAGAGQHYFYDVSHYHRNETCISRYLVFRSFLT